jgi:hypothetical protein
MMKQNINRVNSVSSELNDFVEMEGEKIYNVSISSLIQELTLSMEVSKSRLVSLISWVQVFRIYLPFVWFGILSILVGQVLFIIYEHRFDLQVLEPLVSTQLQVFHFF